MNAVHGKVQILGENGVVVWCYVKYRENAASAMQKWLNQLSCHLGCKMGGTQKCVLHRHANWHHLANIGEQLCMAAISVSVTSGGNTACSLITLDNLVITTAVNTT